jgi:hypothetical protein
MTSRQQELAWLRDARTTASKTFKHDEQPGDVACPFDLEPCATRHQQELCRSGGSLPVNPAQSGVKDPVTA